MKKEYAERLAELKAKEGKSPEEEALQAALVDLEAKEKAQPFDKEALDAAKEAVEKAEAKA